MLEGTGDSRRAPPQEVLSIFKQKELSNTHCDMTRKVFTAVKV
jgi:hypothetical protein